MSFQSTIPSERALSKHVSVALSFKSLLDAHPSTWSSAMEEKMSDPEVIDSVRSILTRFFTEIVKWEEYISSSSSSDDEDEDSSAMDIQHTHHHVDDSFRPEVDGGCISLMCVSKLVPPPISVNPHSVIAMDDGAYGYYLCNRTFSKAIGRWVPSPLFLHSECQNIAWSHPFSTSLVIRIIKGAFVEWMYKHTRSRNIHPVMSINMAEGSTLACKYDTLSAHGFVTLKRSRVEISPLSSLSNNQLMKRFLDDVIPKKRKISPVVTFD